MTKVCSFVSVKGGTGKTTTTVNTGLALAREGFRVLVIDANLEGSNVSYHLGLTTHDLATVHNVLGGECEPGEAIYTHPSGLNLMLGSSRLDDLSVDNNDFKELINSVKEDFDFLIVDCSSGLGEVVKSVINNSHEVLVVTNPELPAVVDALKVINYCEANDYFVKGVVVNKRAGNSGLLSDDIEAILGRPVISEVPEDNEMRRALKERVPIVELKPKRRSARAFKNVAFNISGLGKLEPLTIWDRILNKFIK